MLDQLEVGDHVEIQFSPGESSGAMLHCISHPQMRNKHGRHRTFVGFATEVTIVPSKGHEQTSRARTGTPTERPN